MPEEVHQARLIGERAEFFAHDTTYVDAIFTDGESPLKHAHSIELVDCAFQWKYPLWDGIPRTSPSRTAPSKACRACATSTTSR
nr:DUF3737 family protein [Bifidobacterium saguini]